VRKKKLSMTEDFVGSIIVAVALADKLIAVVRSERCGKVTVSAADFAELYVEVAITPGHTCAVGTSVGELRLKVILVAPGALRDA
jgi:hypothetical protein